MSKKASVQPEPLAWTPWTASICHQWRFLHELPWLGSRARVHRFYVEQLRRRNATVLGLWKGVPHGVEYLPFVAFVLYYHMAWPNTFFMPADSCGVLFLTSSGFDMRVETAILALRDQLDFPGDAFTHLADMTLGELVMAIKN
jgi:hypothetical protein